MIQDLDSRKQDNENNDYIIVDLDALFNHNLVWKLLLYVFKEDFFYGLKLCFIYLVSGYYVLSERLSSYLDVFNLDAFVNQNIIEFLKLKSGKKYFCTNMCEDICKKILNDYSFVFDGYLCSEATKYLTGTNKVTAIKALVQDSCLFYISASEKDITIFILADKVGVVLFKKPSALLKKIRNLNKKYVILYVN